MSLTRFESLDEVKKFDLDRLELVTIAGQTLGRGRRRRAMRIAASARRRSICAVEQKAVRLRAPHRLDPGHSAPRRRMNREVPAGVRKR
jgi:hypothetical protein